MPELVAEYGSAWKKTTAPDGKTILKINRSYYDYLFGTLSGIGGKSLSEQQIMVNEQITTYNLSSIASIYTYNLVTNDADHKLKYAFDVEEIPSVASTDLIIDSLIFALTNESINSDVSGGVNKQILKYIPTGKNKFGVNAESPNLQDTDSGLLIDKITKSDINSVSYFIVLNYEDIIIGGLSSLSGAYTIHPIDMGTTNVSYDLLFQVGTAANPNEYYNNILDNSELVDLSGSSITKLNQLEIFQSSNQKLNVGPDGILHYDIFPLYYLIINDSSSLNNFLKNNSTYRILNTSAQDSGGTSLIGLDNSSTPTTIITGTPIITDINTAVSSIDTNDKYNGISLSNWILSPSINNFKALFLGSIWNKNINTFNTNNIINFSYMLLDNTSYNKTLFNYTDGVGYTQFKITTEATNLSYMFSGCTALVSLYDIITDRYNSSEKTNLFFNTTNVKNMNYMFNNCEKLENLNILNYCILTNLENIENMFNNCNKLKNDISSFVTSINSRKLNYDKLSILNSFNNIHSTAIINIDSQSSIVSLLEGEQSWTANFLKQYYNYKLDNFTPIEIYNSGLTDVVYPKNKEKLQEFIDNYPISSTIPIVNAYRIGGGYILSELSSNITNKVNLKYLGKLDISGVTDLSNMFTACTFSQFSHRIFQETQSNIIKPTLDGSTGSTIYNTSYISWDTTNVEDFSDMFKDCETFNDATFINRLTLSNTTNSIDKPNLKGMFSGCTGLINDITTFIENIRNLIENISDISSVPEYVTQCLSGIFTGSRIVASNAATPTAQIQNYVNTLYYYVVSNANYYDTDNTKVLDNGSLLNIFSKNYTVNKLYDSTLRFIFTGDNSIRKLFSSDASGGVQMFNDYITTDVKNFSNPNLNANGALSGTISWFNYGIEGADGNISDLSSSSGYWSMTNATDLTGFLRNSLIDTKVENWTFNTEAETGVTLDSLFRDNNKFTLRSTNTYTSQLSTWNNLSNVRSINSMFKLENFERTEQPQSKTKMDTNLFSINYSLSSLNNMISAFENYQYLHYSLFNVVQNIKFDTLQSGTGFNWTNCFTLTSFRTGLYYYYHTKMFVELAIRLKNNNNTYSNANLNSLIHASGIGLYYNRKFLQQSSTTSGTYFMNVSNLLHNMLFINEDLQTEQMYNASTSYGISGWNFNLAPVVPTETKLFKIVKFNLYLKNDLRNKKFVNMLIKYNYTEHISTTNTAMEQIFTNYDREIILPNDILLEPSDNISFVSTIYTRTVNFRSQLASGLDFSSDNSNSTDYGYFVDNIINNCRILLPLYEYNNSNNNNIKSVEIIIGFQGASDVNFTINNDFTSDAATYAANPELASLQKSNGESITADTNDYFQGTSNQQPVIFNDTYNNTLSLEAPVG